MLKTDQGINNYHWYVNTMINLMFLSPTSCIMLKDGDLNFKMFCENFIGSWQKWLVIYSSITGTTIIVLLKLNYDVLGRTMCTSGSIKERNTVCCWPNDLHIWNGISYVFEWVVVTIINSDWSQPYCPLWRVSIYPLQNT